MRKNSVTSGRYANVGRICMKSRIGVTNALNRRLSPAKIPITTPKMTERTTAHSVYVSVSMLSKKSPSTPKETKPARARIAYRHPAQTSAIPVARNVGPVQPMEWIQSCTVVT